MKNVRLFYKKGGRAKYISHLDMTRFMNRIVRRANLPLWYTEGFNPHPYMTFALPLSLGYTSDYEVVDIRLTDDTFNTNLICDILNSFCPEYIRFFAAAEPIKKTADLCYAEFEIFIENATSKDLRSFLNLGEIMVSKKTKKGNTKEFDVAPKIKEYAVYDAQNCALLKIILPAGSLENINPELVLKAFFDQIGTQNYYEIKRVALLDDNFNLFE